MEPSCRLKVRMRTENKSGRREKERKGLKKRGGLWGCSLIQKMSIGGYTEIPNKPESMKRNTYESQVSNRKVTGCHKLIFLFVQGFFLSRRHRLSFFFAQLSLSGALTSPGRPSVLDHAHSHSRAPLRVSALK